MKTVFPATASSQVSGVSSMAEGNRVDDRLREDAHRASGQAVDEVLA
jgi:hypothetical protein